MFEVTNWKLMWSDMPCAVPLFFRPAVCSDHTEEVLDRKGYPTGESLWSLTFGSCYQVWPKGFVSRLFHACSSSQTPQGWEEKCAFQGGFKATYSLWHGVENFIPLEWPAWTYINDMFPWHSQVKENKKVSDDLVCLTCFTIQILHRRKFRSYTSDNMDSWKAEVRRVRREKFRRKKM